MVALRRNIRRRLTLAADRQRVTNYSDVERVPVYTGAQSLDREPAVGTDDIERRVLACQRPVPRGGNIAKEVFHLALQASHVLPWIPDRSSVHKVILSELSIGRTQRTHGSTEHASQQR